MKIFIEQEIDQNLTISGVSATDILNLNVSYLSSDLIPGMEKVDISLDII